MVKGACGCNSPVNFYESTLREFTTVVKNGKTTDDFVRLPRKVHGTVGRSVIGIVPWLLYFVSNNGRKHVQSNKICMRGKRKKFNGKNSNMEAAAVVIHCRANTVSTHASRKNVSDIFESSPTSRM
jgi:hypothetical protein